MSRQDDSNQPRSKAIPQRGDQSQGGISHEVAQRAQRHASTGIPDSRLKPVKLGTDSLDHGASDASSDGLTGDDGEPVAASELGNRAPLEPHQDSRKPSR